MSRSRLVCHLPVRFFCRAVPFALLLIVGWFFLPAPAGAGTPVFPCDNERLGFGVTKGIQNYDVTPLKAGWYVNWGTSPTASHPGAADYAQLVRTSNSGYSPSGRVLADTVLRNPGSLWLIGNEPDSPYQDNTLPENYARAYHDAYTAIKALDPLAQVAAGGIVQATPLRLEWLDRVWSSYLSKYGQAIPVDLWHIHTFVLREVRPGYGQQCSPPGAQELGAWGADIPPGLTANCGLWVEIGDLDRLDLLQQQILRFRTWMRDHGQQNKPLLVSEYGILFNAELGYGYDRVRDYMLATFDYFLGARDPSLGWNLDDSRLVQRWAWYSLDDDNFVWGTTYGALANPATRQLNPLGLEFARYASPLACGYVDLQPQALRASTTVPIRFGQAGVVKLELDVRNQGTTTAGSHQVRFWRGDPDAGGVLLGTAQVSSVPSRYAGIATVSVNWSTIASGLHTITAVVDADNRVSESREDNNRISTLVDFGTVNIAAGVTNWTLERGPLRPGEATQIRLHASAITASQPSAPSAGIQLAPPAFQATWYAGDPDAGGSIIAKQAVAPASFGTPATLPAQPWSTVISAPLAVWLVIRTDSGVTESTLADNRASLTIPATTDLTLPAYVKVGGNPLSANGAPVTATLQFRVANLGTMPPTGSPVVSARSGDAGTGPEIGRVGLLPSGDWSTPLLWPSLGVGSYSFVGIVDPDGLVAEVLETNNRIAGTLVVAKSRYALPLGRYH